MPPRQNLQPLGLHAVIAEKPPFRKYVHVIPQGGPIQLHDLAGNPTGYFIVRAAES